MTMPTQAFNLYLHECAGTMVQDANEVEGGLASALQKRHKIRDTDLNKLFAAADAREDNTYSRTYLVFLLVLYAGGAYRNINRAVEAASGNMGNAMVTPHWGDKDYKLVSIYEYEPMNLFPGWSLTNTRNNSSMLDRHLILKHSSGAISNEFSGFDQSSVLATPPSIKQAKAVFPQDGAASKLQSTNQHPNSRLRSNSAYSEQLEPLEAKWKQRLDNVEANKIVKNDKIQTLSKFNTLLTELRKTTDGGNQHYQALLTSIVVNFDPTHDTYIAISAAKARWEAARNEMIVYLEKKIAEIDSFASTEQVSLP
jgi:hypothetical protein